MALAFPPYPEVRLAWPTPEVWKRLDAFQPDLVHLAGPVTNGFGGLKYAQSRHLPLVSTYHTALPAYARLYGLDFMVDWAWDRLREIHNATSATLCPSQSTVAELEGRGFERVRLWARGVDARLFAPQMRSPAARARLGAQHGEILVLYVGRLAREKKLGRLAAALRRVSGVRAHWSVMDRTAHASSRFSQVSPSPSRACCRVPICRPRTRQRTFLLFHPTPLRLAMRCWRQWRVGSHWWRRPSAVRST